MGQETIDHIRPRSKGGGSHRANLQIAHKLCNSRKGSEFTVKDEISTGIYKKFNLSRGDESFNVWVTQDGKLAHIDDESWAWKRRDSAKISLRYWERKGYQVQPFIVNCK